MAEPRITTEMVVADLAAVIDAINEADDRGDDAAGALAYERKEGLAALLGRLPCERPEHSLLRAAWALEELTDIADVALGKGYRNEVSRIDDVIRETLLTMARAIRPGRGTPWRKIMDYFVGSLGEDEEPDPLVEMERRYGELLDEGEDSFDAADDLLIKMAGTAIASVAGVAVMARILINSTKADHACWDEAAASAILEWVGRQTGRNEFIGAANVEKVGIEPAEAEARA